MTDTSEWRFYDCVNKKVVGWKEYMNNPAECISIHITKLCFPGETWNVREIESGHDKKFRFALPCEYIKKAGGLEKMRSIWFKSEDYEPVRLTDIYLPMDECRDRKIYLDELFRENGIDLTDIDAWLIVDDEKPKRRLIDADAAIEKMRQWAGCDTCDSYKGVRCRACTWSDCMDIVEDLADAEMV